MCGVGVRQARSKERLRLRRVVPMRPQLCLRGTCQHQTLNARGLRRAPPALGAAPPVLVPTSQGQPVSSETPRAFSAVMLVPCAVQSKAGVWLVMYTVSPWLKPAAATSGASDAILLFDS